MCNGTLQIFVSPSLCPKPAGCVHQLFYKLFKLRIQTHVSFPPRDGSSVFPFCQRGCWLSQESFFSCCLLPCLSIIRAWQLCLSFSAPLTSLIETFCLCWASAKASQWFSIPTFSSTSLLRLFLKHKTSTLTKTLSCLLPIEWILYRCTQSPQFRVWVARPVLARLRVCARHAHSLPCASHALRCRLIPPPWSPPGSCSLPSPHWWRLPVCDTISGGLPHHPVRVSSVRRNLSAPVCSVRFRGGPGLRKSLEGGPQSWAHS